MNCVKTGFHAYLEPYGAWLYGDAFELELDGGPGSLVSVHIFRICEVTYTPRVRVKHFTIRNFDHWFDERQTSMNHNSTMICSPGYVTEHGYEGVAI